MKENILRDKSYQFALRIVKLYKYLADEKKEYVFFEANSAFGNFHRREYRRGKSSSINC